MKKSLIFIAMAGAAGVLSGCAAAKPPAEPVNPECAVVTWTAEPIRFDGALTEPAWQSTPVYPLSQVRYSASPRELARIQKDPFETGTVRFLWDESFLYVGCELEDGDVFNDCAKDQMRLFRYGDLLEFFVMPEGSNFYWEFYAAPNGAKSSFFYPGCSFGPIESVFEEDPARLMPGFAVKTQVGGTLNDHADQDRSWSVEMRIPLAGLAQCGTPFAPEKRWTLLVARYNYGVHLYLKQGSSFPKLPCPGYNQCQYFLPAEIRPNTGVQK